MISSGSEFVEFSARIVLWMLCLSMLLAVIRLIRGPSLPDRVVALDLLGMTVVGFIAINSVAEGHRVLMMAAVVVALIMFIGTVAFAFFVRKGGVS